MSILNKLSESVKNAIITEFSFPNILVLLLDTLIGLLKMIFLFYIYDRDYFMAEILFIYFYIDITKFRRKYLNNLFKK